MIAVEYEFGFWKAPINEHDYTIFCPQDQAIVTWIESLPDWVVDWIAASQWFL